MVEAVTSDGQACQPRHFVGEVALFCNPSRSVRRSLLSPVEKHFYMAMFPDGLSLFFSIIMQKSWFWNSQSMCSTATIVRLPLNTVLPSTCTVTQVKLTLHFLTQTTCYLAITSQFPAAAKTLIIRTMHAPALCNNLPESELPHITCLPSPPATNK